MKEIASAFRDREALFYLHFHILLGGLLQVSGQRQTDTVPEAISIKQIVI